MLYCSDDNGKIYQQKPTYSKPSLYRPKGWTETVEGYMREAKQWAMCLLRNRRLMRRDYTWVVHLNLNEVLTPDEATNWWPKVCRKLNEQGIVCCWVREPNRLNKLHYHILIKNTISKKDLKKAIVAAMPSRKVVKWRQRVEEIESQWHLCHYVAKAKVRGPNKKGEMVDDLYRKKRLLFRPNLPFKKIGTVGAFWVDGKNKKKLWDEIKAIEKRIAEGMENPNVRRLAGHVHDLLGSYVPLKTIERSFAYFSETDEVQNWIASLLAGDSPEQDGSTDEDDGNAV